MKISKVLRALVEDAKAAGTYWAEQAKLDFSLALERQRRAANITYAEIAKRIGSSPAYVSKVFRGDSNLTLETMSKLAQSAGGVLEIKIVNQLEVVQPWSKPPVRKSNAGHYTTGGVTYLNGPAAHRARCGQVETEQAA